MLDLVHVEKKLARWSCLVGGAAGNQAPRHYVATGGSRALQLLPGVGTLFSAGPASGKHACNSSRQGMLGVVRGLHVVVTCRSPCV